MSRIRGRGNKDTEVALARLLRRNKISGWRRQQEVRIQKAEGRSFKARPDFVFRQARLAIFVDGLLLALLPRARDQAEEQSRILASEIIRKQKTGPNCESHAPTTRLGSPANLATRTDTQKRESVAAAHSTGADLISTLHPNPHPACGHLLPSNGRRNLFGGTFSRGSHCVPTPG